jgi:hypothetical protein
MFGGSGALSVSAGITLVYTLGATLPSWKWVCLACGCIPVAVFCLMPFLPETPNWLVLNGKREEAYQVNISLCHHGWPLFTKLRNCFCKAILWLRGPHHDVEGEIKALENSQKINDGDDKEGRHNQKMSTLRELTKPSAFKPFILLILVFVLQQSTGTYAVIFYAVNVFQVNLIMRRRSDDKGQIKCSLKFHRILG